MFAFLYGGGGNGKSVFLEALGHILGDYATTTETATFTASKSDRHSTGLAALKGARLVVASETQAGRAWDETKVKQVTGGDKMSARFMNENFFTFTPQLKLIIAGNNQPRLDSIDDAMRRRLRVVPFTIRPAEPDPDLGEKLKAEAPGILSWMIAGCLEWQREGLGASRMMTEATDEYFESQDTFGTWLDERCITATDQGELVENAANLFVNWSMFARQRQEPAGTQTSFAARMKQRGFKNDRRRVNGKQQRVWVGIELDPAQRAEFREAESMAA